MKFQYISLQSDTCNTYHHYTHQYIQKIHTMLIHNNMYDHKYRATALHTSTCNHIQYVQILTVHFTDESSGLRKMLSKSAIERKQWWLSCLQWPSTILQDAHTIHLCTTDSQVHSLGETAPRCACPSHLVSHCRSRSSP